LAVCLDGGLSVLSFIGLTTFYSIDSIKFESFSCSTGILLSLLPVGEDRRLVIQPIFSVSALSQNEEKGWGSCCHYSPNTQCLSTLTEKDQRGCSCDPVLGDQAVPGGPSFGAAPHAIIQVPFGAGWRQAQYQNSFP